MYMYMETHILIISPPLIRWLKKNLSCIKNPTFQMHPLLLSVSFSFITGGGGKADVSVLEQTGKLDLKNLNDARWSFRMQGSPQLC